jgi:hypothetical protein
MINEKFMKGKRYHFVVMNVDVYESFEILSKYPKNGIITIAKFKAFCKEIYKEKTCFEIQEQSGFILLFYGENKVQEAIEVVSSIYNQLEFFNKTISLIPYNLETRCVIGRSSLIYETKFSQMINRKRNHVYKICSQAYAGEILITDRIYNQLSSDQKRYFYFNKLFERYFLYKVDTTFLFNKFIQETSNVIKAMKMIAEKFKFELKDFSIENLDRLIDIYKYINILKILNRIVLDGNDMEFFSENLNEGYKFLYKLKNAERVIGDLVDYVEKNSEQEDDKLFIIFNGISNQLEWYNNIELRDEIERLEFILENRKISNLTKLESLIAEKNEDNCNRLLESLLSCEDHHKQYFLVKRILHLYFGELILYVIAIKAEEDKKDQLACLSNILWEHLYLFYYNSSNNQSVPLSLTRIPYISKRFEDFILILVKKNLADVVKLVEKYDAHSRGIIAKALFFNRNNEIVRWSIKNIEIEDLWELVASPEVPLPKLWQIYNEILSREETGDFEKNLFFTCVFEKMKTEIINAGNYEDIKLIEKFLDEFIQSDFSVIDHYTSRLDEIQVLYKHKLEVFNKPDNIFEKAIDSISQSIKKMGSNKEIGLQYNSESLEKLKPWVQLQLAKHGFFSIYFICQQKDIHIARAALKRLRPTNIVSLLNKGFLNYEVFFELADMRKFFVHSVTVKALFKYKLTTKKHYTMYRKFLEDVDLREIRNYTNPTIKKLIDGDLSKKRK